MNFTQRRLPAIITTLFPPLQNTLKSVKPQKTENSTAPATGLFLVYAIHTNPFITPRLAPLAANAPRPPTGRCWSIRIIALWAVSGQTWAFLLSHTRLRLPIKINAYFPLSYPVLTCIKTYLCCLKKVPDFRPFLTQHSLTKIASKKSCKYLNISEIYYRYFLRTQLDFMHYEW